MIYPATYDITILQNATWKGIFRVTQDVKKLDGIDTTASSPRFSCFCHDLNAGDKVVFTASGVPSTGFVSVVPDENLKVPCGLKLDNVYYVIGSGLTDDSFYVALSPSGIAIAASGVASGTFYLSRPVDLSGYIIDADLKHLITNEEIATFACTTIDAVNGQFQMLMTPAVSSGVEPGQHNYDISLTSPGGERYYWLTGLATVRRTYSRN